MPGKPLAKLMLIHAETPMHPGSGSALGTVDLPVARERHTQFPFIPGSSLKGVLRDQCRRLDDEAKLFVVFGPDTKNAADHAGALSITDARLLCFPLRSLSGLFAWTICPAVLERLVRDEGLASTPRLVKAANAVLAAWGKNTDDKALVAESSPLKVGGKLVLEEFDYTALESNTVKELGEAIGNALGGNARLASHLALVSDNAFGHSTRFATEVMARIALDSGTKTVNDGALFYEEFLPAGTIFYALLVADAPRAKEEKRAGLTDERGVHEFVANGLRETGNVLQIGANATTGKGICKVTIVEGGAA